MSIADIKSGGWAEKERLTSAQMNDARAELLKCVDGVGGGTYTPSATVSITDLEVGGTNRLKYGSRTVLKTLALAPYTNGTFTIPGVGDHFVWEQNADAATAAFFAIELPSCGTLDTVTLSLQGASGHAALPGTMPALFVYRRLPASASIAETWTLDDPSASTAAYQAVHTITVSPDYDLTGGSHWFLGVRGETGANYVAGLKLLGLFATISFTEQPEW